MKKLCFKPYYKWITLNTLEDFRKQLEELGF